MPLQQPELPGYAPADVPGDEIARLHQELVAKKQAILRWEDGMKQAYNVSVCNSDQMKQYNLTTSKNYLY